MKDYNLYKGVPPYLEDTMKKRYCQEGESTKDIYYIAKRVSDYIASAEKDDDLKQHWADIYLRTMADGYWLPSSPFLMNAGTRNSMLSACFVCGLEDDLESVYDTLKATGMIQRAGGGTGFNFSSLRAEGAPIKSTGGTSSGPLSFMEIFNASGETIKQGGRRRSANMGVMHISHPDIEKFIKYKAKRDKLNMFNVSVAITDEFMEAVIEDNDFDLIEPSTGEAVKTVKAKDLWDMITYYSWENAEPGVLFIDKVNEDNPTPELGDIEATNPCGEIPLLPWEACNLASINVERFVDKEGNFDYDYLKEIAKIATKFLDSAIDVNELPLPIIEEAVKKTRKIGLGLMGLHGALIRMGLSYDSEEGRKISEKIMKCIYDSALEESIELAKEKGVYPAWYESIHAHEKIECRNATLTTIAPTGTISMINDASSSGLEPVFALSYIRNIEGEMHYVMAPAFKEIAKKEGFWTEELPQLIADNGGSAQGLEEIPEKWQKILKTAMEINPMDHVKMQASLQKHVDNSISKTINLPKDASQEYISEIMLKGWLSGLKGMTIYRDGCRDGQVLNLSTDDDGTIQQTELRRGDWAPITEDTSYHKKKVYIGCGKLTLFIGWSESQQRIQEFWVKRSGSGGCERNLEDMTIAMSGMMRLGGNISNIDRAFDGVGTCTSFVAARGKGRALSKGNNCGNAILFAIKEFLSEKEKEENQEEIVKPEPPAPLKPQKITEKIGLKVEIEEETALTEEISSDVYKCPECGVPLGLDAHEGGCITCKSCGYSKCD